MLVGLRMVVLVLAVVGWSLVFLIVWHPQNHLHNISIAAREKPPQKLSSHIRRNNVAPLVKDNVLNQAKTEDFRQVSHQEKKCQMIDVDFAAVIEQRVAARPVRNELLRRADSLCAARGACRSLGVKVCKAFAWARGKVVRVYSESENTDENEQNGLIAIMILRTKTHTTLSQLSMFAEGGLSTLEASLRAYDHRPRLQLSSTALALYRAAGWQQGGFNQKMFASPQKAKEAWMHGYLLNDGDTALQSIRYELGALSHESLMEQKILETHQGLCLAKDKCARMARCKSITYRLRDGVATLWGTASPRSLSDMRSKLNAMAKKSKRVLLHFTKIAVSTTQSCRNMNTTEIDSHEAVSKILDNFFDTKEISHHHKANHLPNITVSLTSLPGRLAQTRPVLESLLHQTLPPIRILVHVPTVASRLGDVVTTLPHWLNGFDKRVQIIRPKEDYGPATKLIPVLQSGNLDPDSLIVVVDDDTLYAPRLLESFAQWSTRFHDAALTATGWPATKNLRYPHWTENYLVYANELLAPHPVAVLRGNCAFAVRPKFFGQEVWTSIRKAPQPAVFMDDVWFSGHLAARGIPRFAIPTDSDVFTQSPEFSNVVTLDSKLGAAASVPGRIKKPLDRVSANEAALRHFSTHWDVRWVPPKQIVSWEQPRSWRIGYNLRQ